jgi:hypothetical protein
VRVDEHLAEGVDAASVERWAQSASVLHSNGDGLDIAVKDRRIVGVRGRAGDRVNHGRLDPKDLYGWQAGGSPDRLTRPLVREQGELVESDWDTAMGRIVARSRELLEPPGGWGRIGFYTSGQLSSRSTTPSRSSEELASGRLTWTATRGSARPPPPPLSRHPSAPTANPGHTPTSTTATRWRCSATTSPRPRRCCGCGCWTGEVDQIRRGYLPWTRATRRSRARPTCTSRRGAGRTRR